MLRQYRDVGGLVGRPLSLERQRWCTLSSVFVARHHDTFTTGRENPASAPGLLWGLSVLSFYITRLGVNEAAEQKEDLEQDLEFCLLYVYLVNIK